MLGIFILPLVIYVQVYEFHEPSSSAAVPAPVLLPEKWLLTALPELLPLPELFSSLPVLSSLLQLIENNKVSDNNVIRNVLRELLIRRYNSRFALLNVYTVSHFYASSR